MLMSSEGGTRCQRGRLSKYVSNPFYYQDLLELMWNLWIFPGWYSSYLLGVVMGYTYEGGLID